MNCSEIQQRLSEYYDSELGSVDRDNVAAHLKTCRACADELSTFVRLSELRAELAQPQAPGRLWNSVASELEAREQKIVLGVRDGSGTRRHWTRILTIAAGVLIMVCAGILYTHRQNSEHRHLAANFDAYLTEFARNPETAHDVLLAKYEGEPASLDSAIAALQYEPAIATGLPQKCSLNDVYMLNMPCCRCAMAICRCDDGRLIAVFEHDEEQPIWFGDRPKLERLCGGRLTSIIQLDDQLAATWKQGTRYVTVVGVRDVEELTHFVAALSRGDQNGLKTDAEG